MNNEKKQTQNAQDEQTETKKKYDKPLFQNGGIYFHAGCIIGKKNVFVTDEYIDLVVNAIQSAELKMDIKNLGYVVMPNFFYWMFRLSDKQSDPTKVYGKVKMQVAAEILKNLQQEAKEEPYEMCELFKGNDRVNRSPAQKILWTFEEHAKEYEGNKRYRVWAPKTGLTLIDSDEKLKQKLEVIRRAPVTDRWQMVARPEQYPYLYIADELLEGAEPKMEAIATFLKKALSSASPAPATA